MLLPSVTAGGRHKQTKKPPNRSARARSTKHSYLTCALIIDRNKIIRNPFDSLPAWGLKVRLDLGLVSGRSSIGLDFRSFRNGSDSKKAKKARNKHSFSVN